MQCAGDAGLEKGASVGSIIKKHQHQHDALYILSASGRELNEDQLCVLDLMSSIIGLALAYPQDKCQKLTKREREILGWAAEGKSTWDISKICGIAESTVKFHFNNIFLKLDVHNRPQAVVKAVRRNLI